MTSFAELYGREREVEESAPGRVNLIGEHTDYSGGYVLPTPIPQRTTVELARRSDRRVRIASEQFGGGRVAEYELGREAPGREWVDYVAGVTRSVASAGGRLAGFDARVASDVPVGGGLSSSAALEIALLRALRAAFGLAFDDVELAVLGRRAENEFVGAPVGIMDQMAASVGRAGEALFLDTRSLGFERVAIPRAAELAIVDSGIPHSHAKGEYRKRREECERAAELLGVKELRDVGLADLPRVEALPEPFRRRARHVVTENSRVLEAVSALRGEDLDRLGALIDASHESLRGDFEVSTSEIDRLVELARGQAGVFGARMTGGGFGGAILLLARRGAARTAAARAARAWAAETGRSPSVL